MGKNTKIAIGCGVLIVLGMITVGVCGFINYKFGKTVLKTTLESSEGAREFVQNSNRHPDSCIKEYVRRLEPCSTMDVSCSFDAGVFGASCMSYVEVPEGYCEGVPGRTEMLDGPIWARKRCEIYNSTNEQCHGGMLQMMMDLCHPIGGRRFVLDPGDSDRNEVNRELLEKLE